MRRLHDVPVRALDPGRFASVLEPAEFRALVELIDRGARELRGRAVWNVNSTAAGGGVAELLRPLLGYARGGGVDARWVVISGTAEFFDLTKRLHNRLHGFDGAPIGEADSDRDVYERTLAANGTELSQLVRPGDIVILHDPQTAGLVPIARAAGATVIWRCHVGLDRANAHARRAWSFLEPYVEDADTYVFSRAAFAWEGLRSDRIAVIQPSIDAFSPKNAPQTPQQSLNILARAGLLACRGPGHPIFTRYDGSPGRIDRRASVLEVAPLSTTDRIVTQVSRWDRLKDPIGVMRGFAEYVAPRAECHLLLAGPATDAVADDPEGAGVLAAVRAAWQGLSEDARGRVHVASLPMVDVEENAAIVNALQRCATVVVQKSLAEGFGLTVAEAMWKQRPVVASRIGGIQDQIVDGESGVLISDPHDLRALGSAIVELLADPDAAARIGLAARRRVRDEFLGPRHLRGYLELIERLTSAGGRPAVARSAVDLGVGAESA